jgi:peptide/nickel transport system substrate-binding protein
VEAKGKLGRLVALTGVAALALAPAGCGGGSVPTRPDMLRGTTASFPDYLDPALSLSIEGWSAMWNTYIPLLTYRHATGRAGTELIPGLATGLPKITDGGRTYTLTLRRGLRYSDGEAILASDFRHSVERALTMNSGGSPLFEDIAGAARFARMKKGRVGGIEADDGSGRVTIHLLEPSGTFVYALATLYGAPLPADTPDEDLSADPPPASGPYEIVSSKPGGGWGYERNPEWRRADGPRMPQLPGGHFARIKIDVMRNPETQVEDVERGESDWMVNPPPTDRLGELRQRFAGGRLLITPEVSNFYFWMNTTVAPFDSLAVRRAVNYAIDPAALERIYGGEVRPLQQVLPASMPGHRTIRPYPHDLAKAKELIARADPRERHVAVWTDSYQPNLEAGEYYEGVLRELGFQTTLKVISPANYFTVIGNSSTPELDTGLGNWLLEYPHPDSYFEPQLTRAGIRATNGTNWSRFDDPALDAEVARLRREPLGPRQEAAYAGLDRQVMRQAPWAPFGQYSFATFVSAAIDPGRVVVNPVYGQDLTSFSPYEGAWSGGGASLGAVSDDAISPRLAGAQPNGDIAMAN